MWLKLCSPQTFNLLCQSSLRAPIDPLSTQDLSFCQLAISYCLYNTHPSCTRFVTTTALYTSWPSYVATYFYRLPIFKLQLMMQLYKSLLSYCSSFLHSPFSHTPMVHQPSPLLASAILPEMSYNLWVPQQTPRSSLSPVSNQMMPFHHFMIILIYANLVKSIWSNVSVPFHEAATCQLATGDY